MFRKMLREKQALSKDACTEILRSQLRGVLSVSGDDGYPYGLPMNHFYCEENGKIYFHCGKAGHKLDAVQNNDKVSFCVYDEGFRREGEWALNIRSVIVFGRIKVLSDPVQIENICRKLCYKFTEDETYIEKEIAQSAKATLLLELTPEHMTGKLVNEA